MKCIYNINNITNIDTFLNIRNKYKNNQKNVDFVRLFTNEDINKIKDTASFSSFILKIIDELPFMGNEDVEKYTYKYENYIKENTVFLNNSDITYAINEIKKLLPIFKKNITESIQKNYFVKIFYYLDIIFKDISYSEYSNIKIIVNTYVKDIEYLFFYMLSLLGIDILFLLKNEDLKVNEELLKMSKKVVYEQIEKVDDEKKSTVKEKDNIQKINNYPPEEKKEKTFEQLALLASSIVMIKVLDGNKNIISTGSGIMIGDNGYILTNAHVVYNGVCYIVQIENDEKEYMTNSLIKYNYDLDLAVIKIDKKLNSLKLHKDDDLVRGQKVVAIGSPRGFFNSVSDGIISGFRNIDNVNLIQFTAPISAGSSGGALLNMYGNVIGISTSGIEDSQNINFAVSYKEINDFVRNFI